MRILGFSKRWPKLQQNEFTTFRYPRGDTDWYMNEQIQIVIQPRRKGGGEKLGVAEIISKERREFDREFFELSKGRCAPLMTDAEAREDDFTDLADMIKWMEKTYGHLDWMPCMNKLTLRWIQQRA